jgi:hypothetical protein
MGGVAAEPEPSCDLPEGPLCSQCHLPMRLQRSEPPYIETGRTVRVFRCQSCGLLEVTQIRSEAV